MKGGSGQNSDIHVYRWQQDFDHMTHAHVYVSG